MNASLGAAGGRDWGKLCHSLVQWSRNRPLCCEEDDLAPHTQDPAQGAGCEECLELVATNLADGNCYRGRCLHCRREGTALGGVAWRRIVRKPCPHCGRAGWRPETDVSTRRNQTSRAIDRQPARRPIIG